LGASVVDALVEQAQKRQRLPLVRLAAAVVPDGRTSHRAKEHGFGFAWVSY